MRPPIQPPLLRVQDPIPSLLRHALRRVLRVQLDRAPPLRNVAEGVEGEGGDGWDEVREGGGEEEVLR